jgi:hypothetical protein
MTRMARAVGAKSSAHLRAFTWTTERAEDDA